MGEHGATILLAVADEDRPHALARHLRESGLEAVTVGADEALERLGDHGFDVLVASACACPAAAQLVEEALRREPEIQIVVAAGRSAFDLALACLRSGASDVISSPIESGGLLSAVTRAIERGRARGLARETLASARSAGLGQLTGGVAHEIANPLAILTSSLDAASQSFDALAELYAFAPQMTGPVKAWWERSGRQALEQAHEVIADAHEGAQRLKLLARDLRDIAHCDPSVVGEVQLGQAVDAALRITRAELTNRLAVAVDVPPRLVVLANRGSLIQALVQVLVRAAHAVEAGSVRRGNLHVRAQERDGTTVIEFEDDIPSRHEPVSRHIRPYLPTGLTAVSGALCLAAARDLVERQGGALTARARPGGGTVLSLEIQVPRRADRAASR